MKKLLRPFVISFLRSSFKGEMRDRMVDDRATTSERPKPKANPLLTLIARIGGKIITPRMKSRIQGYLINSFRVPMALVPVGELQDFFVRALEHLKSEVGGDLGDYLEFGVYQGNSLMAVDAATRQVGLQNLRLFGFDSFEGLPADAEWDGPWSAGEFSADYDFTRERLTQSGINWDRTVLTKGFFSDSLTPQLLSEHKIEKASLIMVDCDLYSSACETLAFCAPLIKDTAIILFDDWNSTSDEGGEKRAFREFLEAHPEFKATEFGTYADNALSFVVSRHPRAA